MRLNLMVTLGFAIMLNWSVFGNSGGHGAAAPTPDVHGAPAAHGGASEDIALEVTPTEALSTLMRGNARFVKGLMSHPNQTGVRREETAKNGQKPIVSILSCSDSRVPLEVLFDAGVGDVFVIRIAGNIADKTEIGSLEYGVGHLGTPLLIVMGHSKCGAVTAVVKKAHVGGSIPSLIDNIAPAVAKAVKENPGIAEDQLVVKSIKANVWQSVEDIFKTSEEIRMLVREGKLKVVGALYDIETGVVTNLGVHYRQDALLKEGKRSTVVH